jgi:nitronate monooxygenase
VRGVVLDELETPIVLAPLAGGPATVDLSAAVCEAGALGFLAAGYRSAGQVAEDIAALRARTTRPFGVNVFVPPATPADPATYGDYAARIAPTAEAAGAALGEPRSDDDDDWDAKIALLLDEAPPVVSFVFGCPPADTVATLRGRGIEVWVTVTSAPEGAEALAAGADALVAQGSEAGGHRATFADGEDAAGTGLIALLQLLRATCDAPLVAAGGVSTGAGVAAALAAGARAAALGSAFMLTPEAGTAAAHREALAGRGETALTRAFTGRTARGIVNDFMREHDQHAPLAYPEVHHLTAPMRKAARERGDTGRINLWAGQAHELALALPAAEVVRKLTEDARAALDRAALNLAPRDRED